MFVTVVTIAWVAWSETNLICTNLHSPTPKTPCFVKNRGRISYISRVMANFLLKFPNFRYHGNKGRLIKVWLTPLNWPTPKTPYYVHVSWTYLLHKLSYSRFCVENHKFLLPWQQGSVRAKCDWHSLIGWPWKPYHRTKNYDSYTCIQPELWQFKNVPVETMVFFFEFSQKFS